jgi:glycosyltransferase involved in cell wall biosynthesis
VTSPHVGFVLEQTLGHITHTDNLRRLVPRHGSIDATFVPVEYAVDGLAARVPGYGNWTVRAGIRARRAVRQATRRRPFDAMFVHTQVPAVLMPDVLRKVPTVVSLDATPRQYDELGEHYAHATGNARVEELKWRANRACFRRAAHLVTWAQWTKDGLVSDYGVDADKVTVIPPGVDPVTWARPHERAGGGNGPVRILFVGGDLQRKGGRDLIAAVRRLRADDEVPAIELHLVTRPVEVDDPGVVVHTGMQPNSSELISLYHSSDVFCLPTMGDCLPMVLSEAGAAGLPLVSTAVGAISEIVRDGDNGFLVMPGDVAMLTSRLRELVVDPTLRQKLGQRAEAVVSENFDAAKNAAKLVELMAATAHRAHP